MIVSIGSASVEVPNPELGDTKGKSLRVGLYRTMSGDVHAYRATPVPKIYSLRITGLTTDQAVDLAELIDEHIEEAITFTWPTGTCVGNITNKVAFKSVDGRNSLRETVLEIRG